MNESTAQDDRALEEKTNAILKQVNEPESQIKLSLGVKNGQVILNFGKPMAWIGFNAAQAEEVGKRLRKLSKKLIRSGGQ